MPTATVQMIQYLKLIILLSCGNLQTLLCFISFLFAEGQYGMVFLRMKTVCVEFDIADCVSKFSLAEDVKIM